MNLFDVPYISQLEPNGIGYNNCGPACVAMALAYVGVIDPTREAMHQVADVLRDGVADGNWALGTYTTIDQAYWYARNAGADVAKIGSWPAIWAELDAGNPVMILVDNRLLQPRQYDRGPAFDAHHFILLTGFDGQQYRVNDPLAVYVRAPGWYTAASVEAAVTSIGYVSALTIRQRVPAVVAAPLEELGVLNVEKLTDEQMQVLGQRVWGDNAPFVPGNALPDAWAAELRAGRFRGYPDAPEFDLGGGAVAQYFLKSGAESIAVWWPDAGVAWAS